MGGGAENVKGKGIKLQSYISKLFCSRSEEGNLQENLIFAGPLRTNTEEKEITQQLNDINLEFIPQAIRVKSGSKRER